MRRSFLAATLIVALGAPVLAGEKTPPPPMGPGSFVRVTAPTDRGSRVAGRVVSLEAESIVVQPEDQAPLRIPLDSISRLELRTRHGRPLKKSALIGAAIGAAVGAAYWTEFDSGSDRLALTTASAGAGAVYGLIVGAMRQTSDWMTLPAKGVSLQIAPVPRGAGLQVAFRF